MCILPPAVLDVVEQHLHADVELSMIFFFWSEWSELGKSLYKWTYFSNRDTARFLRLMLPAEESVPSNPWTCFWTSSLKPTTQRRSKADLHRRTGQAGSGLSCLVLCCVFSLHTYAAAALCFPFCSQFNWREQQISAGLIGFGTDKIVLYLFYLVFKDICICGRNAAQFKKKKMYLCL